jgi:hypothetical protein
MKKLKNIVPTFAEKNYSIFSEKVEKCCSNIQHFLKMLKMMVQHFLKNVGS